MPTMSAIRMHEFGPPEVLMLETLNRPEPDANEVLVKVLAASVNPVDWKIRQGGYPAVKNEDLPIVPGRDLAGEIVAIGNGVSNLAVGDRIFAFLGPKRGAYEEYAVVGKDELATMPASVGPDEAAAVPLAGITAWQGLFDHGGLTSGQRVLIHGGSGGVGHLAIQFAKAKGAWVATTVSDDDIQFAKGLGADQVIDYKKERFEEVTDAVDVVFDLIGGETRDRSFGVLKNGGILVSTLGDPDKQKASEHAVRVAGYMAKPNGQQLAEIGRLIDEGKVRVTVSKVYPLEEAVEAQRALEKEHARGKIVLKVA
jgi:NADPH:quinone reductase-like Zn-dependent oxidoreductase